MSLKPELPHHRAEFDRVSGHRWSILGAAILVGLLIAFLAPVDHVPAAITVFFALLALAVVGLETKLFLIYRRDLQDRRQ